MTTMAVLDDKTAIVTGAARGIGRAAAELLVEHGANVLIADVDGDRARRTASEIGGPTGVFTADITEPGVGADVVQTALDTWGGLDIIVNNAGFSLSGPFQDMTDERWQAMLDVHLTAPFHILRAAAPYFTATAERERTQRVEVFRKVVNVGSLAVMGSVGRANYAAAKAGLMGLTRSLAKEWGPIKVNVNAVCPGAVETRLIMGAAAGDELELAGETIAVGQPPEVIDQLVDEIPFGRLARPEEIAGSVFFLCSPWSNWVTGQVLNVGGGQVYGM